MTLQELGAYMRLLCQCWLDRTLPPEMEALARICHVTPVCFTRLWPALEPCFMVVDGRLMQPRIERERQKQETYRELKAEAGRQGGRPKANGKQRLSRSKANESPPSSSSSSSSFPISVSDLQVVPSELPKSGGVTTGRSKRPIFSGQRIAVFEWMFDDLCRMLGSFTDDFDLHEWFFTADTLALAETAVVSDWWPWLKAKTLEEAQRRGLPIAVVEPSAKANSLSSRMALMVAKSRAEAV